MIGKCTSYVCNSNNQIEIDNDKDIRYANLIFEDLNKKKYLKKDQMKTIKRVHDNIYLKENNFEKPKQIHKFICKLVKKKTKKNFNGSIVDFGSGNGELIFNLKKFFPNSKLSGVEINKNLVQMSKKKLKKYNFKIISGSVLNKKL